MKNQPKIQPNPFPAEITMRMEGLVQNEQTQEVRARVIWPSTMAYTGEATILQKGPELWILFKGEL